MSDARPQTHKIFLSYSRRDYAVANLLGRKLQDRGVSVWIDKFELTTGAIWRRKVDNALKNSEFMLYLHSFDSEASDEVWFEWGYFLEAKKPILPVILDNTDLPYPFVSIQHITFNETQLHTTIQKILAALGINVPVPPDDPNDPGSGAKRPIREHSQEEQEQNYAYTAASRGDGNRDTRSFHLFIIELRQADQIDLDDSIRKEIEEIIDYTERDGVPIRPSDVTHLEFEIIDSELTSRHTDNPSTAIYIQNSLEHTRQPLGMDRSLKNFNQYNTNDSKQIFSLYRETDFYDAVLETNRVNNIISRFGDIKEINSSDPQFIVTRRGSGWMFYPDAVISNNRANTGSNSYTRTDGNSYTNSYDCPN